MSATVRIKILRPMFINGARVEAGAIVDVDALVAHDVVAPGAAELLDPGRAQALIVTAAKSATAAALRACGPLPREHPLPWVRRIA
jgi:hypothetical protein